MSFIHVSKDGRFYELCSYNSSRDVSSLLSSDTSVNIISHYRKENWPFSCHNAEAQWHLHEVTGVGEMTHNLARENGEEVVGMKKDHIVKGLCSVLQFPYIVQMTTCLLIHVWQHWNVTVTLEGPVSYSQILMLRKTALKRRKPFSGEHRPHSLCLKKIQVYLNNKIFAFQKIGISFCTDLLA